MSLRLEALKIILKIGVVAGTLDGLAAVLMYSIPSGKDPMNVFRYIASGVFGKDAFAGGASMAMLGILFHYVIATGWAALFFIAYSRMSLLSKNKVVVAAAYGIFVGLMMNLVIVPFLSRVPVGGPKEIVSLIKAILVLILCIGLPVTLMTSKFYSTSR